MTNKSLKERYRVYVSETYEEIKGFYGARASSEFILSQLSTYEQFCNAETKKDMAANRYQK